MATRVRFGATIGKFVFAFAIVAHARRRGAVVHHQLRAGGDATATEPVGGGGLFEDVRGVTSLSHECMTRGMQT